MKIFNMRAASIAIFVASVACSPEKGTGQKEETGATQLDANDTNRIVASPKADDPSSASIEYVQRSEVEDISASHILVGYAGTRWAETRSITRTQREAQARARELYEKLHSGADFEELAKEQSDCDTKMRSGNLDYFPLAEVLPEVYKTALALGVDQISKPVQSPRGYHIVKRNNKEPGVKLAASLIIVLHEESVPNPEGATRSRAEALAMAKSAITELKGGAEFNDVVKKYSNHPNKDRGGSIGNFYADNSVPDFVTAVRALEIGKFTLEPMETPLGFHVIKRDELMESFPLSGSRILILHDKSKRKPRGFSRSPEDALKIATQAIERLKNGADFAQVANEFTDHPIRDNGGFLGEFLSDKVKIAITKSIISLKEGEFSPEPVNTEMGYQIFMRHKLKDKASDSTENGKSDIPTVEPGPEKEK